ncbi:hypothetical protein GCM10009117_24060 [Gangjinia marincola]|uniref:Beta-lactamase-related domain-containing protein n=1 Tax=Gangjinia marincola TaxID=578463 RepID=A0ABN1MJ41_9FLAO
MGIGILFSNSNRVFAQKQYPVIFKEQHRILKKLKRKEKLVGLALQISIADSLVYQDYLGYANKAEKQKVDSTTVFRLASISKAITAATLAVLVNEGIMELDKSVHEYIPYFPKKNYPILIRQLAFHTGGIRSYRGNEFMLNESRSIREGINLFINDSLEYQPGTKFLYSTFGFNLISLAIQEETKTPFEEIVQQKLIKPLALEHVYHNISDIPNANLTSFYQKTKSKKVREAKPVENFYKLGGGGFYANVSDILSFGNSWRNNSIVLNPIKKQFVSKQRIDDKAISYGLGWEIGTDQFNRPYYGHSGGGVGASTYLLIYPNEELVISFLANTNCNSLITREYLALIVQSIVSNRDI